MECRGARITLPLHNCQLMLSHRRGLDLVGKRKCRIQPHARIARRHVFVDEQFQDEVRDLDLIDRNRIHLHPASVARASSLRFHNHLMHAGEQFQ